MQRMRLLTTALIFACGIAPAESINPATKPQTAPMSARQKTNLDPNANTGPRRLHRLLQSP